MKGRTGSPLFLVLDGIQDSGNLGSLLRTAESAGVDAVIVPEHRAAGLRGQRRRFGGGAGIREGVQVPNLVEAIKRLKDAGLWVVGADQEGGKVLPGGLAGADCSGGGWRRGRAPQVDEGTLRPIDQDTYERSHLVFERGSRSGDPGLRDIETAR